MKIKIWQAFASNNSGSYTIVGSFETPERAAEVAAALRAMAEQHTAWLSGTERPEPDQDTSPLARFIQEHGLFQEPGRGTWADWPEYDGDNVPDVLAIGHQVLVHVDYTVSMPPTFGEFFYKRGGRVTTELDHAHAPLVAKFEAYWPWSGRDETVVARSVAAVIDELTRSDGVFDRFVSTKHPPSCRTRGQEDLECDLMIACVFDDLCAGCRETSEAIARHGGKSIVHIVELAH